MVLKGIHLASGLSDARVLLKVEPSEVRKPESADRIMWVVDGFAVEVVCAVVTRPVEDCALVGDAVREHDHCTVQWTRLVRAVGPKAVCAA